MTAGATEPRVQRAALSYGEPEHFEGAQHRRTLTGASPDGRETPVRNGAQPPGEARVDGTGHWVDAAYERAHAREPATSLRRAGDEAGHEGLHHAASGGGTGGHDHQTPGACHACHALQQVPAALHGSSASFCALRATPPGLATATLVCVPSSQGRLLLVRVDLTHVAR